MHRLDLSRTVHRGRHLTVLGGAFDRDCVRVHRVPAVKLFGELGDTEAADQRRQVARIVSGHHGEDPA